MKLHKKTLLEKADLDKAIDFMDVIEEDVPKGKTILAEVNYSISFHLNNILTQALIRDSLSNSCLCV